MVIVVGCPGSIRCAASCTGARGGVVPGADRDFTAVLDTGRPVVLAEARIEVDERLDGPAARGEPPNQQRRGQEAARDFGDHRFGQREPAVAALPRGLQRGGIRAVARRDDGRGARPDPWRRCLRPVLRRGDRRPAARRSGGHTSSRSRRRRRRAPRCGCRRAARSPRSGDARGAGPLSALRGARRGRCRRRGARRSPRWEFVRRS